jgi:hypothetical protein
VRDFQDDGAVLGVRDDHSSCNEGIQLRHCLCGQLVPPYPPSNGAAQVIHSHQPQQTGDNIVTGTATRAASLGEGGVSLADQRTLDSTKLVVSRIRHFVTACKALGKLSESKCEQRQGLAGVSVCHQPSDQFRVDADAGQLGRA